MCKVVIVLTDLNDQFVAGHVFVFMLGRHIFLYNFPNFLTELKCIDLEKSHTYISCSLSSS